MSASSGVTSASPTAARWGYLRNTLLIVGVALLAIGLSYYHKQRAGHCLNVNCTPLFVSGALLLIAGIAGWIILRKHQNVATTSLDDSDLLTRSFDPAKLLTIEPYLYFKNHGGRCVDRIFSPHFYLGDERAANALLTGDPTYSSSCGRPICAFPSLTYITEAGIKTILSIGKDVVTLPPTMPPGLRHEHLAQDAEDPPLEYPEEMVRDLPQIAIFIADNYENLFVHCRGGRSRSVSAVVFYLMEFLGVPLNRALGFVQSRHPYMYPTVALLCCLQYHEDHKRLPTKEQFDQAMVDYAEHPIVRHGRRSDLK